MARSEAPQDPRPYIRVSTDLPTNPKIAAMDNPAEAIGGYVTSLCLSGQSLRDGHFPLAAAIRISGISQATAEALAKQGLWHLPGHLCDRCEQPSPGNAVIHDYLQHQRSAAEVRDLTEKRREAGRKGARKRWQEARKPSPATPDSEANAIASAMANAQQVLWQNDGKHIAEERRGEEIRDNPPGGADKPRTKPATKPAPNAQAVVGAYINGATEAGHDKPTTKLINIVGRDAKRLLTEGIPLDKLIAAAQRMGAAGWHDLDTQLQRDSAARTTAASSSRAAPEQRASGTSFMDGPWIDAETGELRYDNPFNPANPRTTP